MLQMFALKCSEVKIKVPPFKSTKVGTVTEREREEGGRDIPPLF